MPRLMVVLCSTRPGRVGKPVAEWFRSRAEQHGSFDVDFVDLAELALPLLDEPHHPRLQRYEHDHTRAWSARVAAADAVVFVLPEYNYSFPASAKNAVDYLLQEWQHKPVAIVSYGGISAGLRSAIAFATVLRAVGMISIGAAVSIPSVSKLVGEDRALQATEQLDRSADAVLSELARVESVTRALRAPTPGAGA